MSAIEVARRPSRRAFVLVGAGLALLLHGAEARADDPAERAQALFDEAVARMEAGDFAGACPLLQASQDLDPASGTALDLGYCYERTGAVARAYEAYRAAEDAAVADERPERVTIARRKLDELAHRVAFVQIVVPEPARGEAAEVSIDERVLTDAEIGKEQVVEDGPHTIVARVHGAIRFRRSIVAVAGAPPSIVTVVVDEPQAPPAEVRVALAQPPARGGGRGGGRRLAALATGIAGVAALGTGAALGALAIDRHGDAERQCDGGRCTAPGVLREREASAFAWGANVGIAVGLVALGAATYLFLSSPRGRATSQLAPVVRF